MTQQAKKPASAQGAAARAAAGKITQTAFGAAESTRQSAKNVVNMSAGAVRDILASSTGEAQKAQKKAFEMGREGVENFARSADIFSRMMTEMVSICRDNMEACLEACNTTANVAGTMTSEISECCNRLFSDSIELSKEAFECRTVNDLVELQSKAMRQTLDTCFNETNKLCNMAFECCNDALEPINERVAEASEKLSKVMTAA